MKLSQLRGLILIKKYASISKAAQKIFISQSALSVSIKDLEEELGNILFIRNKNGVEFTRYGLKVLEHAENICAEVDMIKKLDNDDDVLHGNIHLGISSYLCNIIAVKLILTMEEMYPHLQIRIHQDKNINIISDISCGNCNLGLIQIGILNGERVFPEKFLKSKLIFNELFIRPVCVAVSKNHPLLKKKMLF